MNNAKYFHSKKMAVSWGRRNHPGRFRVEQVGGRWKVTYNGFYGSYV